MNTFLHDIQNVEYISLYNELTQPDKFFSLDTREEPHMKYSPEKVYKAISDVISPDYKSKLIVNDVSYNKETKIYYWPLTKIMIVIYLLEWREGEKLERDAYLKNHKSYKDRELQFNVISWMSTTGPIGSKVLKKLREALDTCWLEHKEPPPKKDTAKFFDLQLSSHGLALRDNVMSLKGYNKKDIIDNYNQGLVSNYDNLINSLNDQEPGFYFFTGKPGTGKSSFILHLMTLGEKLKKNLVVISSSALAQLTSPDFIDFSKENLANCILIIEDGEDVVHSRQLQNNPYMGTLLNLTSGIYAQLLKIKIIVTVNIDSQIDDALLRKGRLKFRYDFEYLETTQANKVLKNLNKKGTVDQPTKLADLYNFQDVVDVRENKDRKTIGFKKGN